MLIEYSESKKHSYYYTTNQDLPGKQGFRSVCQYLEEDARAAAKLRDTSILKGCTLIVDTLFMDFDDCEGDANTFQTLLNEHGLMYERYDSGNRSVHFHLPVNLPPSPYAMYTVKQFASIATDGKADTSYMHHAGLFRLPDTVHERTGKRKEMTEKVAGDILALDIEEPKKIKSLELDLDAYRYAMSRYTQYLNSDVSPGNRHQTIWKLSKNFCEAGVTVDTCAELIYHMNRLWSCPKEENELKKAIYQAYRLK